MSMPPMLRMLVLLPTVVQGHSYLAQPPSRNLLANVEGSEDCPHCLQSGGPGNVKDRGGGVWPSRLAPGSHGLCGDPVQGQSNPPTLADETYLKSGPVTATYQPGQIVEFQIAVSTHHMGHYEFRICDQALDAGSLSSAAEGQRCLDQWLLERAPPLGDCVVNDPRGDCQPMDPKHPERWYLPPAGSQTPVAGPNFEDSMAPSYPNSAEVHVMRYKIPEGLSCSARTLQWYWASANSCVYDGDYFDYYQGIAQQGWDASAWHTYILEPWANCENSCCNAEKFGEEFWNCADIAVVPSTTSATTVTTATTTVSIGDEFSPVDGGEGRACRGASATDNRPSYYTVVTAASLDDCKAKCQGCRGIEFSGSRCEVWSRSVEASIPLAGFTCLRYGSYTTTTPPEMGTFSPVDGGENRVCRGANANDNSASYFTVVSVPNLELCKLECAKMEGCVGIEHKGSRCEVWTRAAGIEASREVAGYWCLRYSPPEATSTTTVTTTASGSCNEAWGACGGQNWDGPTCCEDGYTCQMESVWYSQCRPSPSMLELPDLKKRTWKSFRGTTMLQDGTSLTRTDGEL